MPAAAKRRSKEGAKFVLPLWILKFFKIELSKKEEANSTYSRPRWKIDVARWTIDVALEKAKFFLPLWILKILMFSTFSKNSSFF